ncbi:MAG: undecaprenyldiphospho-muramoylpentapeptide beta-N-acetylglucosaminyltransferase [Rikenellaceae bacterium]
MKKIIVSGGGTGGHIYPAVAVAEALIRRYGSDVEILFVGAEGRMEMDKIPPLGYNIVGLPIAGLQRRLEWRNILLPYKVLKSISRAKEVIRDFGADIVVGFGGYASAPILWTANRLGVPTVVQEQNSYAGLTNKIVARGARKICVAYDGMERFFNEDRIVMTGNPLRGNFSEVTSLRAQALEYFGLNDECPVVLVVGGSLGTRTLNNMMCRWVESAQGKLQDIQVIWQTGKIYEAEMQEFSKNHPIAGVWQGAFLERMDLAYAAADIVISRSGACTVSELSLVAKPTIFVPSPNVAEDHQTKNAMALVEQEAALMVPDSEAGNSAMALAVATLKDRELLEDLRKNISKMAFPNAADVIVDEIDEILKESGK